MDLEDECDGGDDKAPGNSWAEALLFNTGSLQIGPGIRADPKAIDVEVARNHPVTVRMFYPHLLHVYQQLPGQTTLETYQPE